MRAICEAEKRRMHACAPTGRGYRTWIYHVSPSGYVRQKAVDFLLRETEQPFFKDVRESWFFSVWYM